MYLEVGLRIIKGSTDRDGVSRIYLNPKKNSWLLFVESGDSWSQV